jgi:hypothetical protein
MARSTGGVGGGGGTGINMPDANLPLCAGLDGLVLIGQGGAVPSGGGGGGGSVFNISVPRFLYSVDAITLPFNMELHRSNRDTGAVLTTNDGYANDAGGKAVYNGAGWCDGSAYTFEHDGGGFTVAVEWDMDGGSYPTDQPSGGRRTAPQQLVGVRGNYDLDPDLTGSTRLEIADPTANPYTVQLVQVLGSTYPVGTVADTAGGVFVVVFRRMSGRLQARVFRNGTLLGTASLEPSLVDTSRLVVGDLHKSDGALGAVAIWQRPLTDAQVALLGDDMTQLQSCSGITGPVPPFLGAAGDVLINPKYSVPRTDQHQVLASEGVQRHTRSPGDYVPRRYVLEWQADNGDDLALVLAAVDMSRGGCVPVQWRHPTDDPELPAALCPRWWIVNASELQRLEVARQAGGHVAGFQMILEEVI